MNILNLIAKANYHRKGGIDTKTVFRLEENFYGQLKEECLALAKSQSASKVQDKDHITNWVGPFGDAVQFSLFNKTGDFNDYSTDHDLDTLNKKFHYSNEYPNLDKFIKMFPNCTNFRLNGMGKNSGLSPHEEHIVFKDKKNNTNYIRARFHLPIMTNTSVEMLLGKKLYRYKEGEIYFFNNGSVHSANNKGETYRFHLLWDMVINEEAYNLMFNKDYSNIPFELNRVDEVPEIISEFNYDTFHTYGPAKTLFEKFKLNKVGLSQESFAKFYNYYKSITAGQISLAENS